MKDLLIDLSDIQLEDSGAAQGARAIPEFAA
jgi:hypothetical protein